MNAKATAKPINLAFQGGGAHGAFTWGVADRLLEDGRLRVDAISGTSAGAMNAAVIADGFTRDGPDGARQALEAFWHAISAAALASPVQRTPIDMMLGNWSLDFSPGLLAFDLISRLVSPYEFNPLNINPLRDLLEEHVDFERVRRCTEMRLFVSATNVHTGRVRVFENDEMTCDAVMASACLPYVFQAVEIDGVPYWDGGFIGNPALYPFFYETATPDVMLVQINPVERAETPTTAREIHNRMNEIAFNAALLKELRAIEFVTRLIDDGKLSSDEYMRVRMHRIGGDGDLTALSASSKFNAEWKFLTHLRDIGREAADQWLAAHIDDVGTRGTFDLRSILG